MAGLRFSVNTATDGVSSTPKTVVGAKAPANQAIYLRGVTISFDGLDVTKPSCLIEICNCTWASNSPGTNSTAVTPLPEDNARPETIQSVCGKTWTTEPTVVAMMREIMIPVFLGTMYYEFGNPFIFKGGSGPVLRVSVASGTPSFTGGLHCEE